MLNFPRHRCVVSEVHYLQERVSVWPITTFGGSSPTTYWESRAKETGKPGLKFNAVEYLAIGRPGIVGAAKIDPTPPEIARGWLHFRREVSVNYAVIKQSDQLRRPPGLVRPTTLASIPIWGPPYINKVWSAHRRCTSAQTVAGGWDAELERVTQKFIVSTQTQLSPSTSQTQFTGI